MQADPDKLLDRDTFRPAVFERDGHQRGICKRNEGDGRKPPSPPAS
jgi:hypothetical protein